MAHVSGNPTWQDFPSTQTPVSAHALENIEQVLDIIPDITGARDEAVAARDDAVAARDAAEAVPTTNDTVMASVAADEGSAFSTQLSATYAHSRRLVDRLPVPCFMSHGSADGLYGEHTLEGLLASAAGGFVLDCDLQLLADTASTGDLAVIHDPTLDRTTFSTGDVSDLTASEFRTVRVRPAWSGARAGLPFTFHQLLELVGGRSAVCIEFKTGNEDATLAALDEIVARGYQRDVIVQSFTYWQVQNAALRGICAMYLGTDQTAEQLTTDGVEWIACSPLVSDAAITAYKTAGIKVARYTLTTRQDVLTDTSFDNIDMFVVSDPWACSGYIPANPRPDMSMPWPGLRVNGAPEENLKFGFDQLDGSAGWQYLAAHTDAQGAVVFPPGPTPLRVRVDVQFLAGASANDRYVTLWAGKVPDGRPQIGQGDTDLEGYFGAVRRNGNRELHKRVAGNAAQVNLAAATSGQTPYASDTSSASDWFTLELAITDTAVTFTDVTHDLVLTSSDTTFRGADALVSVSTHNNTTRFRNARIVR